MVFLKPQMSCYGCQLSQICIPGEMPPSLLEALHQAIDQDQSLNKGEFLVRPGDSLHYLYALRMGSFKAWQVDAVGHERIIDFYLPGELIGLEALAKKQHSFSIQALEKTAFCRIHYSKLAEIIQQQPELQSHLLMLSSLKLNQYAQQSSLEAETRLVNFLQQLRQRLRKDSPTTFSLSMSRADLGNYLNLTPETISRLFTRLKQQGRLSTQGKRIQFHVPQNW